MNIYEILENGAVVNTVVADEQFMEANHPGAYRLVGPVPEPARPRHITQYAFRQRFTQAERVSIEIASLDDPSASMSARQQAAALRVSMADLAQARYVDLDNPTVSASLAALEAAGLLAAGRANEISSAAVQDTERP